jgi:hypothetical protein
LSKRQLPEIFLGSLLTIAVFCIGFVVAISLVDPVAYEPAKKSAQEASGAVAQYKPIWADPNWFIVIFSLCLVVVAIRQYSALREANKNASRAADVAEKTLVAAHRPWISVDIAISGPLKIVDDILHMEFVFVLTNSGNAPANHVSVSPVLLPNKLWLQPELARLRAEMNSKNPPRPKPFGPTVFPGKPRNAPIHLSTPKERFVEKWAEFGGEATRIISMEPELVGTVVYLSPTTNTYHYTLFAVAIGKRHKSLRKVGFAWQEGLEIKAEDLILEISYFGGGAN